MRLRRQRRIEAFHPHYRRFIADLTSCSPALEDLADTFPALLFALATGYATPAKRERAFDLVSSGAPLREAADALGLAWWLRKLPPQAFTAPLPAFPRSGFRLAHRRPDPARSPSGPALARARQPCPGDGGRHYALWVARQPDLAGSPDDLFKFMAAWAWFSDARHWDIGCCAGRGTAK